MGADCTFAHSTSELRPSPKPCFDFVKTGYCVRGQGCRFVHEAFEMKTKSKLMGMQNSTFPAIQAQADPSPFLATYMMPTYTSMHPMSLAEAQQVPAPYAAYENLAPSHMDMDANVLAGPLLHAPPVAEQIPLPFSLIGGLGNKGTKSTPGESHGSSLSEAALGFSDALKSML